MPLACCLLRQLGGPSAKGEAKPVVVLNINATTTPASAMCRVMQRGKELAFPLVKVDSASDSVLLVDGVPVQPE